MSASVVRSSVRKRREITSRSRGVNSPSAWRSHSARVRWSRSRAVFSSGVGSWSTRKSCSSSVSSWPTVALSERSGPEKCASMRSTAATGTRSSSAMILRSASLILMPVAPISRARRRRRLKNRLFCAGLVPIRTIEELRTTYSWIDARIHQVA